MIIIFSKEEVKVFLKDQFGITINTEKLGEETVQLYIDELEHDLISKEFIEYLPNPVTFQTYLYHEEAEWIIGIALEAETNNPLFLVCLRNGIKFYEKLLSQGEE